MYQLTNKFAIAVEMEIELVALIEDMAARNTCVIIK